MIIRFESSCYYLGKSIYRSNNNVPLYSFSSSSEKSLVATQHIEGLVPVLIRYEDTRLNLLILK